MIQRLKFLAVVAIAAVLVACGGGGDDNTPSYEGKYLIDTSVSSNTCGGSISPSKGTDVVTQNGRDITIVSGSYTFTGTVDADNNGFTLTNLSDTNGVKIYSTVTFKNTATGGTYTFRMSVGSSACEIVYSGTATKI